MQLHCHCLRRKSGFPLPNVQTDSHHNTADIANEVIKISNVLIR